MLFNKTFKNKKKYLLYNTTRHKFYKKYNKMLKNITYSLLKDSRYEVNNFNKLYVIKK